MRRGNVYSTYTKRLTDVLVSFVLLILLTPFFLIVSILILTTSKGPLFFTQTRVGQKLQNFRIYKFRTMTDQKHEVKKMFGKKDNITSVGYYLRSYKIDELPQLLNVLKGDMSLVGPRPSMSEQLVDMNEEEKRRYSVRPGMTGLAQVSGNIHLGWEKRYKYDLKYINNISLINDLKIVFRTVLLIIIGEKKFINKPLNIVDTH